jgi:thioesterase domain-containing protein
MSDISSLSDAKRALLEKQLGRKDPQMAIKTKPDTEQDTEQADITATGKRERAVMVQAGDPTKRPIFYLHGDWTGRAFYCHPLARDVGEDQPFYILEPYNFDNLPEPPSFQEMAAAHLKSMRAIQPHGPYLLAGWCNGGLIAYEMALQLLAVGEKVDLLVLMDSDAPHPVVRRTFRRAICQLGNLLRFSVEQQVNCFLHIQHLYRYPRFSSYRLRIKQRLEMLRQNNAREVASVSNNVWAKLFLPTAILRMEWTAIYDWIALGYVPEKLYPGKIIFFWDSEDAWRPVWWRPIMKAKASEIENYMLPGSHITCRTDHLHAMSEQLRTCLHNALHS